MTLVKFSPTREFESLHNTIQNYFDDFSSLKSPFQNEEFSPRIDISEKENQVIVTAEIPGVKKEDLKLTLQDNILTIEGEKKNEIVVDEKKYYREERRFGSFKRTFTIPFEVETEKVNADFNNGVLTIKLDKVQLQVPEEKVIKIK